MLGKERMQLVRKLLPGFSPREEISSERDLPDIQEAGKFEVDFRSASPREIHSRLLIDGCCILRNAIAVSSILKYHDMVEKAYASIVQRMKAGEKVSDFDRVNIRDHQFTDIFGADNSFFHLLGEQKFTKLNDAVFGRNRYEKALPESCTRSIHCSKPRKRDRTSFPPLSTHFDSIYHETWRQFSINFWIPFSTCGVGTDLPGLMIYPADFRDVRQYLGVRTEGDLEKLRASPGNPRPMEKLYPQLEALYKAKDIKPIIPYFELGDVMVFNGWVPHATYADGKMTGCRRNLELRFQGDNWEPMPSTL